MNICWFHIVEFITFIHAIVVYIQLIQLINKFHLVEASPIFHMVKLISLRSVVVLPTVNFKN